MDLKILENLTVDKVEMVNTVPNFVRSTQTVAEILRYSRFYMAVVHLRFLKFKIFIYTKLILPNFVVISRSIAEILQFFEYFLLNGIHLPCCICHMHVCMTHELHLVVFITVQYLTEIDAVVDNMQVLMFNAFGLKCLFTH